MGRIEQLLDEEKKILKKIVERTSKRLKDAPKGHLRIKGNVKPVEYYYLCEGEEKAHGRYMKKREMGLAQKLAQRDYDEKVLDKATERIKIIESFLQQYATENPAEVYETTSVHRRNIITPEIISDEAYTEQWKSVQYTGKAFAEDTPEIYTERGERVRSKSEKIIADKLYMLGIPYRYEYPLELDGNLTVYPDFTILQVETKEEVYLEHFGMMDDAEYVEKAINKLNTYIRNGIYPGVHLFITHETGKQPLNIRALDGMLKQLFCERK